MCPESENTIKSQALSKFVRIDFENFNFLCNWSEKHKYIFNAIPKTGSTSLLYVLQNIESKYKSTYDREKVHYKRDSILLSPLDDYGWFKRYYSTYFWFSFVRNPYTRILSAYLDKILYTTEIRPRHKRIGINSLSDIPNFLEFLDIIKKQPILEMDVHFTPQHALLGLDKGELHYSYLGRFENFNGDVKVLFNLLELELDLEELSIGKIDSSDTVEKIKKYFGQSEIELVKQIYEADFRLLDYSFDISECTSYPKW